MHHPACVLLVLSCAVSSAPAAVSETISELYPLSGDGSITLSSVNGSIEITGWDRAEVSLEAEKRASSQDDLNRIHVRIDAQPEQIVIRTEHEKSRWLRRQAKGEVRYKLRVPSGARLQKIDTVNSRVAVSGVSGAMHVGTVNGRLEIRDIAQDAALKTVNGSITAECVRVPSGASLELKTVNGGCELALPGDAGATVRASTVNGGVKCTLPIETSESRRNSLRGTIGDGRASVQIETVNGGITLRGR